MRRKFGWRAVGIIGLIFAPMGLLFVLVGAALWRLPSVSDPVVFLSVFGGIGSIFLVLGLAFLLVDIRHRHLLRRAYDSGNCVDAEIIGIREQVNVNMMNGHPWYVECACTDSSGVVHIYHSRYLRVDVTGLLKSKTVPVYIDPYNADIGFVDIDAVLPEIRIHS